MPKSRFSVDGSVGDEHLHQTLNSATGFGQIVVVEIDVQEVDVPRQFVPDLRYVSTISRAIGSVVSLESSYTSRLLAARSLTYSSSRSRAQSSA